jgi:hypothetical protein
MPIVVTETHGSGKIRTGENATVELLYRVLGTSDEVDAVIAVRAHAPSVFEDLVRKSVEVEALGVDSWKSRVIFGKFDRTPKETGESDFSFNTSGGRARVTQSLDTIGSFAPPGGTPQDFKGAIGVTGESVQGVDVVVPVFEFSETHYLSDTVVTLPYRVRLAQLTGRTNNVGFRGYLDEEVLFLGAAGSRRGNDDNADWQIDFKFAVQSSENDITIGDIEIPTRKGWHYLWVRYEDDEDVTAVDLIKVPASAYVERIYKVDDFADLGIGV